MRNWIAGVFSLLLTSGAAEASDLQSRMYGEPDSASFDWSGPYAGGSIGYGWLRDIDYAFTPPLRSSGEDVIFGIHFGYLHQFGAFVFGAEGELTKLNINFEGFPIDAEDSAAAKVRGGFAIDRFLFTGHGGAVHAGTNIGLADWGLLVGAGIDYAIADNIVAGVSYDHMWFEGFDGTLIDAQLDLLKARVSVKF
jgi:outer membrane immunogenic protein